MSRVARDVGLVADSFGLGREAGCTQRWVLVSLVADDNMRQSPKLCSRWEGGGGGLPRQALELGDPLVVSAPVTLGLSPAGLSGAVQE